MSLNYVELTLDLYDGQGNPVTQGTAALIPTTYLTDTTDHQITGLTPVTATFRPGTAPPVVKLLATDNTAPEPNGWAWTITPPPACGVAAFSFFLPYASGSAQYLSAQVPVAAPAGLTTYLQKSRNLSDVASPPAALANLGGVNSSYVTTAVGGETTRAEAEEATLLALSGGSGPVWNAKLNGLACDDSTDDTSALSTLLTAMATAGGTIFFPSLSLILGQVVVPSAMVGNQPRQAPIRLTGTMPNRPGQSEGGVTFPTGGLDLRYAGRTDTGCGTTAGSNVVTDAAAVSGDYGQIIISPGNLPDRTYVMAVTPGVGYSLSNGARATNASCSFTVGGGKIEAHGIGTLEIDHMLLCDQGTSSQPFVLATGTTVRMHDCAVLGNAAKNNATCDQDIWVGGGPGHGAALTTALTSGVGVTSIAVSALPVALAAGAGVIIVNGTTYQSISVASAAAGATTITTSFTPNANYGIGSAVLLSGLGGAGAPSEAVPAAPFQGYGTHISDCFFNRVRRMMMWMFAADVYIDRNMWWQACGTNLAVVPATLTSAVNVAGNPYTSLAVTALPAAVAVGDRIQLGTNSPGTPAGGTISQVAVASATAAAGATSISINSFTATQTYAIGTKAINTTAGIGAALEVYGIGGNATNLYASSNHFDNAVNYSYSVRCGPDALECVLIGNGHYNTNAAYIANYRFDGIADGNTGAGSQFNTVIPGICASTVPMVDDQSSLQGSQLVLRSQQSQPSLFPAGVQSPGYFTTDVSGNVWESYASGVNIDWLYTALGVAQQRVLRVAYNSATLTNFEINSPTAGGTAEISNNNGLISLVPASGYNVKVTTGSLDVSTAGQGLQVSEGANGKQGTFILTGGTTQAVANTSVTANSRIFITCQAAAGTPGLIGVSSRLAGTSFTVFCSAADTGTYAYEIFEPG